MEIKLPGMPHAGLRRWARGSYGHEAGVELLIRSGLADKMTAHLYDHDRDPDVGVDHVWPDVAAALGAGYWSGGEYRMLRVAANLLGQEVDFDTDQRVVEPLSLPNLAGLDRTNSRLVLAAIAHALGTHQMSDWHPDRPDPEGYLPPLVDWPEVPRG